MHVKGVSRSRREIGSNILLDLILSIVEEQMAYFNLSPLIAEHLVGMHKLTLLLKDLAKFLVLKFKAPVQPLSTLVKPYCPEG